MNNPYLSQAIKSLSGRFFYWHHIVPLKHGLVFQSESILKKDGSFSICVIVSIAED
ncbi:hypothetical protein [Peribacillus butanolivorans]|uniref:hypothetical protein n=1 Tax=Peribacillus butanolivorans TaxID=421767 RepID=UPI0013792403|nr:hypothetical protein [Peribacillus butanolivorans]